MGEKKNRFEDEESGRKAKVRTELVKQAAETVLVKDGEALYRLMAYASIFLGFATGKIPKAEVDLLDGPDIQERIFLAGFVAEISIKIGRKEVPVFLRELVRKLLDGMDEYDRVQANGDLAALAGMQP